MKANSRPPASALRTPLRALNFGQAGIDADSAITLPEI